MAKRLFVGGLPWSVNDAQLQELFSQAGTVVSARVITDRDTGRSKGFGFVEFENDEEADRAVETLNDTEVDGRKIVVNVARPMEERGPRNFERRSFDRGGGRPQRRDNNRDRGGRGGRGGGY